MMRAAVLALMMMAAGSSLVVASEIEQARSVTLRVGQSAVISALTGKCGRLPTAADRKIIRARTGIVSYGREGTHKNRACGGLTPAVEMVFTADRVGSEMLSLNGQPVRILVTP